MHVVVDTNVWVSAMLNPGGPPSRILDAFQAHLFTVAVSEPLLDELFDVLSRPRLVRRYQSLPAKRVELLTLLRAEAQIVPITGSLQLCRDPDDDMVIETAVRARADALVSRDDDLKGDSELGRVLTDMGITVLTVRHFLERLETS